LTIANGLNPNIESISTNKVTLNGSTSVIVSGAATTDTNIKTDVGTLPAGSIYISSNGAGEIWIMQTTTWTKLTVN
jgi:hypothetical protein